MKKQKTKVLVLGDLPSIFMESMSNEFSFDIVKEIENIDYKQDQTWIVLDKVSNKVKRNIKNMNFDRKLNYSDLLM